MHQKIQWIRIKVCHFNNLPAHRRPKFRNLWAFLGLTCNYCDFSSVAPAPPAAVWLQFQCQFMTRQFDALHGDGGMLMTKGKQNAQVAELLLLPDSIDPTPWPHSFEIVFSCAVNQLLYCLSLPTVNDMSQQTTHCLPRISAADPVKQVFVVDLHTPKGLGISGKRGQI